MADEAITTQHNAEHNRYEILVDGELAGVIDYREADGSYTMFHTGIEPRFGGRGLGKTLVQFALDDARATRHTVVPSCPFIARFIRDNPEYTDVLA